MSIGAVSAYGGYQMSAWPAKPPDNEAMEQRFAEMDVNGDGGLDITESKLSEDQFAQMDTDGDGLLTSSDREAAKAQGGPPPEGMVPQGMGMPDISAIMASLDSDGDQAVSESESGLSSEQFDQLDTNQDGVVTQNELEAAFPAMRKKGAGMKAGMAAYQSQNDMSLAGMLAGQGTAMTGGVDLTA